MTKFFILKYEIQKFKFKLFKFKLFKVIGTKIMFLHFEGKYLVPYVVKVSKIIYKKFHTSLCKIL